MKLTFRSYDKFMRLDEMEESKWQTNTHSDKQVEMLAKIMEHEGISHPISIVEGTARICFGHARRKAALKLGYSEFPVVFQRFEDESHEARMVTSDNALAAQSEIDLARVNSIIPDIGPFDIELLGIPDFKIEPIEKLPPAGDENHVPGTKADATTKLGDIYDLGGHRLMCGSSTDFSSVDRLMLGESEAFCFTSPPYNLGTNMKLRGKNASGKDSAYLDEESDHKSQEDYLQFLIDFVTNALTASQIVFCNIQMLAGNKTIFPAFWHHFKNQLIDVMIWDKEHGAPAMAPRVLNSAFEFIFIFSRETDPKRTISSAPEFRGTISNIFRLNPMREGKNPLAKDHGAVFPVSFPETFIQQFSKESMPVYEPFCGSGTTLIAAHKLGRKCYAMELDPRYCDVIVARWEAYTGQKAQLLVSGETPESESV